jgi:hypothetical protein
MRKRMLISLLVPAVVGLTAGFGLMPATNAKHAQKDETQAEVPALICPKCKGTMERGVTLDYWGTGGAADNSFWAPRVASKLPFAKSPPQTKIATYRCTECGYLESYAK